MVDALTTGLAIACAAVALTAAVVFATGRARPKWLDLIVFGLEAGLVVRAMIGVGQMASGDEARSVTHIGYLVASIAILPLVLSSLEGDRSRWSSGVIGIASLVVLVVVIRLQVTTGG